MVRTRRQGGTIERLPRKVLVHILSYVDDQEDLHDFFCTCRSMRAVASDPVLAASRLLRRHHPTKAVEEAVVLERADVLLVLLRMGAPATCRVGPATSPWPLLQVAAGLNYPRVVEELLSRDEVRAEEEAVVIALHTVASCGSIECLHLLLAPPSPANANSMIAGQSDSPLIAAILADDREGRGRREEAVQVLLSKGAVSTFRSSRCDLTALHYICGDTGAEEEERCRIIRMLLEAPHGRTVLDSPDNEGTTPLAYAAMSGSAAGCQVLIEEFGSQAINVPDEDGLTPYDQAVFGNTSGGPGSINPQLEEVLQRHGGERT